MVINIINKYKNGKIKTNDIFKNVENDKLPFLDFSKVYQNDKINLNEE